MARRHSVRRARKPQLARNISSPSLIYTNALPRDDLQSLDDVLTARGMSRAPVQRDFQRPKTAEGHTRNQKPQHPIAGFDFQRITETVPPHSKVDDHSVVGIALGSPSPLPPQSTFSQMQDDAAFPTVTESPKPSSLQRKPSKWKKIGGLFKIKTAVESVPNRPTYQMRVNDRSLHDVSASINFQCESSNKTRMKKKKKPQADERVLESKAAASGSFLQVDIPKVEMERYSVMFSGLLDKTQPSLLARRSKTLEDLSISEVEMLSSTSLESPRLQRRATSPAPKTPSFALFPATHVSKASKVLGTQNLPPCPSPALKVPTAPSGSSRGKPSNEQDPVLMVHSSASQKSHRSQNSRASIDSEYDESVLLQRLKLMKSYVDPGDGQEWEMITKKVKNKSDTLSRSRSTSPSQGLAPLNATREKVDQIMGPANATRQNDDTGTSFNATRERVEQIMAPRNATQQNSQAGAPFNATRERVHQMMTSEKNQPATSPVEPTRLPIRHEREDVHSDDPSSRVPKIEVSIARSISVSKAKRQVLVPIGRKPDHLNPNKRLVNQRGKTPEVMEVPDGHRVSQAVQIETV